MAQSHTSGDISLSETRKLDVALWMFRPHDPTWQTLPSGSLTDVLSPEAGATVTRVRPPREYMYAPQDPAVSNLPVQGAVNRSDPLSSTFVDIEVITPSGTVLQILRYPEYGPYRGLPTDPAWFSESVNPRTAFCGALTPYAAARCFVMGGYW
jgi:hypothetical protein